MQSSVWHIANAQQFLKTSAHEVQSQAWREWALASSFWPPCLTALMPFCDLGAQPHLATFLVLQFRFLTATQKCCTHYSQAYESRCRANDSISEAIPRDNSAACPTDASLNRQGPSSHLLQFCVYWKVFHFKTFMFSSTLSLTRWTPLISCL